MNNKERFTKLAAGLTAAAMISSISLTGCDQILATNPTPSISGEVTPGETTKTSTETTLSSETTLPTEITSEPIIIPTTKPSTETITESTTEITTEIIIETTTEPTTEATMPTTRETTVKPTATPTTKETTATPTTTSTTETTTTPTTETKSELDGVTAERLEFTKDMLKAYDNASDSIFSGIKDYITRDQIINYGRTGEGLSVIKHKDGKPAVALVNCNNTVISAFKEMLNIVENYDSNYLKKLTDNGFVVFMVNRFDTDGSSYYNYSKEGIINWNLDPNKNVSAANLVRPIPEECFGIKMKNLGGDYSIYQGFMKQQLASDCWWNLYKKTGDDFCLERANGSYMITKILYNVSYSPVTFQDEKIQNLLKTIRDENLATSFGGTWSEISASIVDRPDWQE